MAKSDFPPIQMIVEAGPRLAPAAPADAERLDTWHIGSKVAVQFVRNGVRPMEKKWFSILGLVVNQCDVPWTTKESASQAIKLALGLIDYTKTIHGNFMQWPKSLTELTNPELDDAVRDMMDLIHKMTGVDPATLKKESADAGEDDGSETEHAPVQPDGEDSGSIANPPSGDNSDQVGGPASGADESNGASDDDSAPDDEDSLKQYRVIATAMVEDMIREATSVPAGKRLDRLEKCVSEYRGALPDEQSLIDRCFETCKRLIDKPGESARAKEYLMGKVK